MAALAEAVRDLDEARVNDLVDEMLRQGASPTEILGECNAGMVAVGELFASNQYFLTELMFSAEIMKGVAARLEPLMGTGGNRASGEPLGTVVIGTVKGDIHDIGKNIVVTLLRGHGFRVVDLGVDVPPEEFVQAVRETGAKLVGISALLSFTYSGMKAVVDAIAEAGLRDRVKIIVGGAICNDRVRDFTGADYFADDAMVGVNIAKEVVGCG